MNGKTHLQTIQKLGSRTKYLPPLIKKIQIKNQSNEVEDKRTLLRKIIHQDELGKFIMQFKTIRIIHASAKPLLVNFSQLSKLLKQSKEDTVEFLKSNLSVENGKVSLSTLQGKHQAGDWEIPSDPEEIMCNLEEFKVYYPTLEFYFPNIPYIQRVTITKNDVLSKKNLEQKLQKNEQKVKAIMKISQLIYCDKKIVLLVRHGETTYNQKGLLYGATDTELSDKGEVQALNLYGILTIFQFKSIYSSDMKRTQATGQLALKCSKIKSDQRLREMDYGDNELVPYAGFPKENLFNVNYQHPKGESITMVSERAIEFFKECLQESGVHLIFTHGGLIFALTQLIGYRKMVSNCQMVALELDQESYQPKEILWIA